MVTPPVPDPRTKPPSVNVEAPVPPFDTLTGVSSDVVTVDPLPDVVIPVPP